jgi:hydroxylamine reductase
LFTTRGVGYESITHVKSGDFAPVIDLAVTMPGFEQSQIDAMPEMKPFLTGFGHTALLSHAETIVSAIKGGALRHIFVIGGCDGTEKSRSYFTELAKLTPQDSVILTMGCGKYRLTDLELGSFGDSGIPRLIDVGQCNDSYSAVVVAMKLAEALSVPVTDLPLHFAVSWFEQKAVAVLLSLLHLGMKNIRLGPSLPAFLTPNVLQYLHENLGVSQVGQSEQEDMAQMLAGH